MSSLVLSDLILDVANAADPVRRKMALERLENLGKTAPPDAIGSSFARHIDMNATGSTSAEPVASLRASLDNIHGHPMPQNGQSGLQKFEAFILGNFIGLMMPKDNEAVYGKGMAGEMWQSLSAQYIGEAVAKRGGIGLASRLAPHYPQHIVPSQG